LENRVEPESESKNNFKALALNKKIMSQVSELPDIEKKDATQFSAFKLSKSNRAEKENQIEETEHQFRATVLNRKILEEADFKIVENKRNVEASPFNFKTDERLKKRDLSTDCDKDLSKSNFKAKQMPNYNFFELKNDGKKSQTKFREFNIETSRRAKRTHSAHSDHQEEKGFKAQPMPDFSKVETETLAPGTRHTI